MRYIDVKRYIKNDVDMYSEGRFTLPELFNIINREITTETIMIPNTDIKIEYQEKLYKYACQCAIKAIDKMQRMK